MKRWLAAGLVGLAMLSAVPDASATVVGDDEAFWLRFAIPGASTAAFSVAMVAATGAYFDDPGWLVTGSYFAGALAATSGSVYTSLGAGMGSDSARHVFVPVGAVNLGLAVANFTLAATSGPDELTLPVTPVISAGADSWRAGVAGSF